MIYFHFGKPKTGTSTIQRFLVQNQEVLLRKGYLYPNEGMRFWGHHNLYYQLARSPYFKTNEGGVDQLRIAINEFKNKYPNGDIILSSETFSGANPEILSRIYEVLSAIDVVQVILYLRKQFYYLRSFWAFHVKHGRVNNKFAIWAKNTIDLNSCGSDYDENLNTITMAIPKESIRVVLYDNIEKANFCNYFLSICGLENTDDLIPLESVSYNKSTLTHLPIDKEIIDLCSKRYYDSNLRVAQNYFDRDYLFDTVGK